MQPISKKNPIIRILCISGSFAVPINPDKWSSTYLFIITLYRSIIYFWPIVEYTITASKRCVLLLFCTLIISLISVACLNNFYPLYTNKFIQAYIQFFRHQLPEIIASENVIVVFSIHKITLIQKGLKFSGSI